MMGKLVGSINEPARFLEVHGMHRRQISRIMYGTYNIPQEIKRTQNCAESQQQKLIFEILEEVEEATLKMYQTIRYY